MKKICTIAMAFCFYSMVNAQPGTLDNSFSSDGIVVTSAGFTSSSGHTTAIQADGKIVVAGGATDFLGHITGTLVRYNSNGVLDNSFGISGIATLNFGNGRAVKFRAVAIQSNGKIVAAGWAEGEVNTEGPFGNNFVVARFNTNGTLDNTFSFDGVIEIDLGKEEEARAVAIQADGKIIVAGGMWNSLFVNNQWWSFSSFAVVRLTTGGSIDLTFGSAGTTIIDFGIWDDANAVRIQADGKIVIAGYSFLTDINGDDFAVARLNSNGFPDNTFNGNGKVIIDFAAKDDYANAVAVQTNGKIVVAGGSLDWSTNEGDFAIVRINSNGVLDNTFSADGKTTTSFGERDHAYGVAVQTDGKIVAAGGTGTGFDQDFWSTGDFAIARYNSDGSLDNTFSSDGKTTTNFRNTDIGKAVAIQSNGNIVVAGRSGGNFAVARYIGGGAALKSETTAADKIDSLTPSLVLYPNPASNVIHIKGLNPSVPSIISLADISGNILQRITVSGSDYTVNIQQLKAGVYNAIITQNGQVTNLKFIKQ